MINPLLVRKNILSIISTFKSCFGVVRSLNWFNRVLRYFDSWVIYFKDISIYLFALRPGSRFHNIFKSNLPLRIICLTTLLILLLSYTSIDASKVSSILFLTIILELLCFIKRVNLGGNFIFHLKTILPYFTRAKFISIRFRRSHFLGFSCLNSSL